MHCPYCGFDDQKVLDSRPAKDGAAIRRRRECTSCNRRFTTFEEPEKPRLFVIKRDGSRQEFDKEKTFESMRIASGKRPIPMEALRTAAERIEKDLFQDYEDEVRTHVIGEKVMTELKALDTVAYVRFASVYREFETVADFTRIVDSVRSTEAIFN
jgi:transcriptional repressor NrdR